MFLFSGYIFFKLLIHYIRLLTDERVTSGVICPPTLHIDRFITAYREQLCELQKRQTKYNRKLKTVVSNL